MNRNQIRKKNLPIQPQKVLVVDDDPVIRDMMADILECEGHTPDLARNGQEALRFLSGSESYLVFLDLLMPSFNGRQVCEILATHPQVRQRHILVLMSALDSIEETYTLDVDMVMPKPFVVDDVEEALATYMK
ncbi:MAG TPA: response regulator [Ktedonobacteraceae bacterium]|nr:response regulator [Ktedonobacteraceae bacterium]